MGWMNFTKILYLCSSCLHLQREKSRCIARCCSMGKADAFIAAKIEAHWSWRGSLSFVPFYIPAWCIPVLHICPFESPHLKVNLLRLSHKKQLCNVTHQQAALISRTLIKITTLAGAAHADVLQQVPFLNLVDKELIKRQGIPYLLLKSERTTEVNTSKSAGNTLAMLSNVGR